MFKFFRKFVLMYRYPFELEDLLEERRQAKIKAIEEAKKDNLQLCLAHKDREPSSHYASHNCDHCKALAQIDKLTGEKMAKLTEQQKLEIRRNVQELSPNQLAEKYGCSRRWINCIRHPEQYEHMKRAKKLKYLQEKEALKKARKLI